MNESAAIPAVRPLIRWLFLAAVAIGAVAIKPVSWEEMLPFGVAMPPVNGSETVDPRAPITLEAVGLGTRLAAVEVRDDTGKILAQTTDQTRFTLTPPLAFGTRYTIIVTVERAWLGQHQMHELSFTTVGIPKLQGPTQLTLMPDASVTLHFDRPVANLQVNGNLQAEVRADETRQNIQLVASNYVQGQTLPVEVNWQTPTGVPLPPLHLELTTPPPLFAEVNLQGVTNLGLAMPLQVRFSETLAERDEVGRQIEVITRDGKSVPGKWQWIGQRRLQFKPQPLWPATSTIHLSIDQKALRSLRGGTLDQRLETTFSTGPDRRIFVYLDTQRVTAVENGQVVRTFSVSTGKAGTPTVTGSFYIYDRYPHKTMRSRSIPPGKPGYYMVENVPYAQFFHEDYAFHGAWWHNNFGRPASHGCINMATRQNNQRWPNVSEDAGWLYRWASLGVPVTVLRDTPMQMASQ